MGTQTAIEWTDRTWNPWQGCTKVSPGCAHCYMFREKARYGQDPTTVLRSSPSTFRRPLSPSWELPARVFTCSWSDWFHPDADPWRPEAWSVIRQTPHLTYQILTKRPQRIADHLPHSWGTTGWPNVWLGVTAENQRYADDRIPLLLDTPAALRFASCEPLLGPLDLDRPGYLLPWFAADDPRYYLPGGRGLDWVIAGGESGGPADRRLVEPCDSRRPLHADADADADADRGYCHGTNCGYCRGTSWLPKAAAQDWARSLHDQCATAGVPFFFKGWGGPTPHSAGALLDGREYKQFPTSEPPVHCSTAATLTLGAGWTLRLHVHPAPIELDLICARCGKGYSLDLDRSGNRALVQRILDTHQHPDQHTEPTP